MARIYETLSQSKAPKLLLLAGLKSESIDPDADLRWFDQLTASTSLRIIKPGNLAKLRQELVNNQHIEFNLLAEISKPREAAMELLGYTVEYFLLAEPLEHVDGQIYMGRVASENGSFPLVYDQASRRIVCKQLLTSAFVLALV